MHSGCRSCPTTILCLLLLLLLLHMIWMVRWHGFIKATLRFQTSVNNVKVIFNYTIAVCCVLCTFVWLKDYASDDTCACVVENHLRRHHHCLVPHLHCYPVPWLSYHSPIVANRNWWNYASAMVVLVHNLDSVTLVVPYRYLNIPYQARAVCEREKKDMWFFKQESWRPNVQKQINNHLLIVININYSKNKLILI